MTMTMTDNFYDELVRDSVVVRPFFIPAVLFSMGEFDEAVCSVALSKVALFWRH